MKNSVYRYIFLVLLLFFSSCVPYMGPYDEPYEETPYEGDHADVKHTEKGIASFMADEMQNKRTASGIPFNLRDMVAAHPTLPFGSVVDVTNLQNKSTTRVTIIDRGPFVRGRIIDLSFAAAKELGFIVQGTAEVEINLVRLGDGSIIPEEL